MSYPIYIDGEYKASSASMSVMRLNKAQVYEPKTLRPSEIIRARVDGRYQLYRVLCHSKAASELKLASKAENGLGKFYLGGPMRGYDHYNFPAFLMAAQHLKALGFEIVDPASHDLEGGLDVTRTLEEQGFNVKAALGWDFVQIVGCDGIILLDGWENSTGAKAERLVAEMTGKLVYRLNAKLELFAEDDWKSELLWTDTAAPKAVPPANERLIP